MSKKHKCRWAHCPYENKEIEESDEVKLGNAYYHRSCAKQKQDIDEILNIWHDSISDNVVFSQLRKIVNNLIFNRGLDSGYVLACVKDGAKNGYLHYPQGLYYCVDDKKRLAEWKRTEAKRKIEETPKPEVKADNIYSTVEEDIGYKANKRRRGFGGILVGRQNETS